MSVVVDRLENTAVSYKQLIELIHHSFEERIQQGLFFTCSTMTEEKYINKTKDGVVLVAMDNETNELLGTATIHIRKDNRNIIYGYNEYLAISPSAKRKGIGTKLLEKQMMIVINANGEYIESDTAVGAKSSVCWHLKNGFKIVGLQSFISTNYYSYVFRKQLVMSKKWNNEILVKLIYLFSAFRTKILKKENGEYTVFGVALKRISGWKKRLCRKYNG